MINNKTITYYHKTLDPDTRLEKWEKIIIENIWVFCGKASSVSSGYTDINNIAVRIPMEKITDTSIFDIGDIIAIGVQEDIEKQSDLKGVEYYNVTSININDFGNNPHIHLGGQ